MIAAKVTGGSDELAVGEGITNEAAKLGEGGVASTIADLDMVIAQGIAARKGGAGGSAPGPIGPPIPGASAAAPGGPGAAPFDPSAVGMAVANGMGAKVIRVEVTNPKDIGGGGGPTGAGPATPGWKPR